MRKCTFDYAIVRVVPCLLRGEFLNAGVIVYSSEQAFLQARIALDTKRLRALAPDADSAFIEEHLAVIPRICVGGADAGPIGLLEQRERWHWLVAPRSTIVQTSAVHCGLGENPAVELDKLFRKLVL
jgi:hypothetical protein